MDDFILVVIAASVFMVIIYLISFIAPWVSLPSNHIPVANFTVGKIGVLTDMPTRTESYGDFVVGEEQTEVLETFPQLELATGLLGGKVYNFDVNVPDWYSGTEKGVSITFDVYDTNRYGNLVVRWNGKPFLYEPADKGRHSFVIDPDYIKDENKLQIYAEGPGMFFWASTAYILRNFDVSLAYGPGKLVPLQTTNTELEAFSRGMVTFYATGARNRLNIKVNGVSVYNDYPKGFGSTEFDYGTVPLNRGTNILSFSSPDTVDLRDVELNLYLFTNEAVGRKKFNITNDHYSYMNSGMRGIIDFDVDTVIREGGLEVRLNDRSMGMLTPEEGWNRVTFTANDVLAGENTITFSGTGGFMIGKAGVSLIF
jgi:hypothetical protein